MFGARVPLMKTKLTLYFDEEQAQEVYDLVLGLNERLDRMDQSLSTLLEKVDELGKPTKRRRSTDASTGAKHNSAKRTKVKPDDADC